MKMNTKKFGMLAFLAVIVITLISGCVNSPEVITPPEEVEPPTTEPSTTEPPTSDVTGNEIINVPRYPNSIRTSYWSFGDDTQRATTVGYITSASIDEVLGFYKRELPANGWIDIAEMQTGDTFFLLGHKDGVNAQVHISPDEYYSGHISIELVKTEIIV